MAEENKANIFQTIVLVIFGMGAVFAVLIFSGALPIGRQNNTAQTQVQGSVTMWGTLDAALFTDFSNILRQDFPRVTFRYLYYPPDQLVPQLTNELASGRGPDIVLLPHDSMVKLSDKVYVTPYQQFPFSQFQSTYLDGASVFLTPEGVASFPLLVDPMVMYYNRNITTSNFLLEPPQTWEEIIDLAENITQRDNNNLTKSTVALGGFDNVTHPKSMMSLLMLQLGNPIVAYNSESSLNSVLNQSFNTQIADPAAQALAMYESFADPDAFNYSWNPTLPNDLEAFLAEDLAFYFGFASDLPTITARNPNLNFDVAIMPQMNNVNSKTTYAKWYGVSVPKASANVDAAYQIINTLNTKYVPVLSTALGLPPTLRSQYGTTVATESDTQQTIKNSAIISQTWLDPDTAATDIAFKDALQMVASGAEEPQTAINRLHTVINNLINPSVF